MKGVLCVNNFFGAYGSICSEFAIRSFRSGLIIQHILININPRDRTSGFGLGFLANVKILKALIKSTYLARPFTKSL